MKKVLAICMMIVMVFCTSVTAFAAVGGFISSPSGTPAPGLIDYSKDSDDCDATPIITPYSERNELPDDLKNLMEDAYKDIVNNPDLSKLNPKLSKIADEKNIDVTKLAVSDLFNLSYTNCDSHSNHGKFNITIKPETVKNFVGLMYFNGTEWTMIDNAKVDGEYLLFTTDVVGPMAVVVNTGAASTATPQTGDNSKIMIYVVIMLISAGSLLVLWRKLKKQAA